jgi:GNAT superfamily N-acetyltransferase
VKARAVRGGLERALEESGGALVVAPLVRSEREERERGDLMGGLLEHAAVDALGVVRLPLADEGVGRADENLDLFGEIGRGRGGVEAAGSLFRRRRAQGIGHGQKLISRFGRRARTSKAITARGSSPRKGWT